MKKKIQFLLVPVLLLVFLSSITANASMLESTEDFSSISMSSVSETSSFFSSISTSTDLNSKIMIDTVEVSFFKPTLGAFAVLPTVSTNANYSVDEGNSFWRNDYNVTSIRPDERFFPGYSYSFSLSLVPNEGYAFHEGTQLYLNGDPVTPAFVSSDCLSYYSNTYTLHYEYAIARVDVLVTLPKVGEVAQMPTVPDEGYNIDPDTTYWKDETTGKRVSVGEVFKQGHSYKLYLGIRSDIGFLFTDETTLYVTQSTGGSPAYVTDAVQISIRTETFIQSGTVAFDLRNNNSNSNAPPSIPSFTPELSTTFTSPKTFDAGVGLYIGMSIMAIVGSTVVINKKKN